MGADSYSYDAMGNTLSQPDHQGNTLTHNYGAHQRLIQNTNSNGASGSYTYNGRGERVQKQFQDGPLAPQHTRVFLYNESGQLVGEYDATGNPLQQYLWLDDLPIGVIQNNTTYALHADHLGTPRAATDSAGTTLWRWNSEATPFGENAANSDPDGDGTHFELNLRFPGQYYDAESGLHYNYFRDYQPGIGRYVESDPIGLGGGINTYSYTKDNPLIAVDVFGLFKLDKSCDGCNLSKENIEKEVAMWCESARQFITDNNLNNCIRRRCNKAKIKCETDPHECGNSLGFNESFLGIRSPTVNLCPKNIVNLQSVGIIVIHEWAHSCGWKHFNGKGVPGNNGYTPR